MNRTGRRGIPALDCVETTIPPFSFFFREATANGPDICPHPA